MNLNKVFFSYSRVDASEFTLKLALDLKKAGFNVWIDQQDIRAGTEWDLEIEKALETCDCLLFIESGKSVISNNVLDEVYYALEQKKRVIPIIYHDSKTPFRIQRLQHIDFSSDYDIGLANLTRELKRDCREQVLKQEEQIASVYPAKNIFKRYAILFTVLATAIVFATVWMVLNNYKKDAVVQSAGTVAVKTDTIVNETVNNINDEQAVVTTKKNIAPQKEEQKRSTVGNVKNINQPLEKPIPVMPAAITAAAFAGNWALSSVQPKPRLHSGYLKIEALDENKVKLLSNMQFYYFPKKALAYVSVFNAFASCNSCLLQDGMKIIERDIDIGTNIFEILKEDGVEGKAGDTVTSGGRNKAVNAYVSLHLLDKNTISIKIEQPKPTTLDDNLMVSPFAYDFLFKRND